MLSYHVVGARTDSSGNIVIGSESCEDKVKLHSILAHMLERGYVIRVYYGESVLIADDLSSVKWGGSVVSFNDKEPEYVETLRGGNDGGSVE